MLSKRSKFYYRVEYEDVNSSYAALMRSDVVNGIQFFLRLFVFC